MAGVPIRIISVSDLVLEMEMQPDQRKDEAFVAGRRFVTNHNQRSPRMIFSPVDSVILTLCARSWGQETPVPSQFVGRKITESLL